MAILSTFHINGLSVALLSVIAYLIGLITYRLYFHPLSKFRGPAHLAMTELFTSYHNQIRGTWYMSVLKLHDKYGPIVRVGPNHLAIDGSIGWPEIYGHKRASRPEFGRVGAFFDPENEGVQNIFVADRENHRRQRRLMAHAFSDTAMYEQERLITGYVDMLMVKLGERADTGEAFDVVKWFNFTTFDIIGDLAFADSFGCLESSNMHPWVALVFASIKAGSLMRFAADYPLLKAMVQMVFGKKMMEKRKEHKELAAEKTRKRLALGPTDDRKDFLAYMLKYNDEKGMSEAEILNNSDSLILAGSETTATALSGLTYYLTTNPVVMKRLVEEIRSSFATEDEMTMRATARLPYLHACIEEGLRLFPPAAETPPRTSPGDYVNGKYIPEGTTISVYQWATYHSTENFVEALEFRPERWLPSTHPLHDPKFELDNKAAFSPFSAGPRNCIGKNLAYAELRLIISRFLWNFDVALENGYEGWPERLKVYIIWEKTPLMVRLAPVARGPSVI